MVRGRKKRRAEVGELLTEERQGGVREVWGPRDKKCFLGQFVCVCVREREKEREREREREEIKESRLYFF